LAQAYVFLWIHEPRSILSATLPVVPFMVQLSVDPVLRTESVSAMSAGLDVQNAWVSKERDSLTDLSVLVCAALLMKFCMAGQQPVSEHGKGAFVLLVGIWYWTTTTWAAETKEIMSTFQSGHSEPGFPLLGFWLTFVPQLVNTGLFALGLWGRSGSHAVKKLFLPSHREGSFWPVAGAGYWYGQFFTVQSLLFGNAALTFCVKCAEPLSTALLAVLVLRNKFSLRLVLGVLVACLGIMLTVISADHLQGDSNRGAHSQLAGLIFGVLANIGYSSRACVAKKALLQKKNDAFETCGILTAVGAQTGVLPVIAYAIAGRLSGNAIWALPFFDPRFSARGWFMMSLSYSLYQICSVLILSAIAVESHALLVAMKHLLVAVLVSLVVHAQLTRGMLVGMTVTLLGVYIYMQSAKDNPDPGSSLREYSKEAEEEADAILLPEPSKAASWQVPVILQGIVFFVVVLGAVTPITFAALGLSGAAII